MVMPLLTRAVVLGSLLSWSCLGKEVDECSTGPLPQANQLINLCHDTPRPKSDGPYECSNRNEGFVLKDPILAPRSTGNECNKIYSGFLNVTCLREHVVNRTKFDAAVFDLLEKVSGKNQIDNSTVVDRLSFPTSDGKNDSSAFVIFKQVCKPVKTGQQEDAGRVVSMCSANSDNGSTVYLTLGRGENLTTPFRCRCHIRATQTLALRALDVRLQQAGTRHCQPGLSLTIQSENKTEELPCDGQSAHYGLELLFTGTKVTLDLHAPARIQPTKVWLQAEEVGIDSFTDIVHVWCEDVIHLPSPPEDKGEGTNVGLIVGLVVGVLVFIGVVVTGIVIFIIRWRRQREEFTTDPDTGHIYATPGKPRASTTNSFEFPDEEPQTPPPLPDLPAPGAPPLGPPKPARSFHSTGPRATASDAQSEEYDRLMHGGRKEEAVGGRRGSKGVDKSKGYYDHMELENKGVGSQ